MEDTKPLVTEKEEFQYRMETLKIALFGISEVSNPLQETKSTILPPRMLLQLIGFSFKHC